MDTEYKDPGLPGLFSRSWAALVSLSWKMKGKDITGMCRDILTQISPESQWEKK